MRIILDTQVKTALLWFGILFCLFLFYSGEEGWREGGGGRSHRRIWSCPRFLCILIGGKHREVNQEQVFFISFFFFYLLYFYPSQNVIYEVINTEQAYMDDLSTTLEVSSWLKLLFIL